MTEIDYEFLREIVAVQPFPLVFATISGAHLYGFPSPDSDYDLRGTHILPLEIVLGLEIHNETIEDSHMEEDREMDIVSHDIHKFFHLLLKKNGYVLEQLYSPLVVHTTEAHEELKAIASGGGSHTGLITRHHSHHYFGFAETQRKLFQRQKPKQVKPLLYTFRVLLTGIHLMRTGKIEANITILNEEFNLPYINDLVALKSNGTEEGTLPDSDISLYEKEFDRLRDQLQSAFQSSSLPELPAEKARVELNDLIIRIRMGKRS